jgi:hypothetical protein
VVILIAWFGATFGIAFAVVEWRANDEPSFFCKETFRAAIQERFDNPAQAEENVRLACGENYLSN